MQRSFPAPSNPAAGVMSRLVRRSWSRINARFRILATDEESAYYAWVDEYLDRLTADAAAAKRVPPRSKKVSTMDEGASVSPSAATARP